MEACVDCVQSGRDYKEGEIKTLNPHPWISKINVRGQNAQNQITKGVK